MLVNVHQPVVALIRTHEGDAACPSFHTVQLAETRDSGAQVALFIASDWSNWDAIVSQVQDYRRGAIIRAAGAEHGRAAGSWVIDGNTSREHAQRIIDGYNEGDPEIMDMTPAPLSGEWADGPLPGDVLALIDIDEDDDASGEWLDEYETAFSDAYWDEVIRAATIAAGAEHGRAAGSWVIDGNTDAAAAPTCERHGGAWGGDQTCADCTDEEGNPRPCPEIDGAECRDHEPVEDDDDRVTVSVAGEENRVWFGTAQLIEKIISEAKAGGETDDTHDDDGNQLTPAG